MQKNRVISCAVLSAVASLAAQAGAATFVWTGAAGDGKFETPGNYNPSTAYPGQNVGGDTATFDATSGAGVSISNSNLFPTYQPFGVTFNNANAFTVGTLGTTSTDLTASGTTIRLQAGTANQVFNINLSLASTGTTTAFTTLRNDTTLATGPSLTVNGNVGSTSAAAGRPFGLSFFGTGTKIANGVISNSTGGVATTVVVSSSGDTSGSGAATGVQYGAAVLTAANTYSGGTTVSGQTLFVNNTAGSGTGTGVVTVNNLGINQNNFTSGTFATPIASTTGILSGTGTVAGTIAVQSGGSLRPGGTTAAGSTGNLTSTNATAAALVLSAGSTSVFDINGTAKGAAVGGYDAFTAGLGSTITYGGALTINGNTLTTATYDLFSSALTAGDFASVTLNVGATPVTLSEVIVGSGVFSATSATSTYTFTTATGDLVVGVPEPATLGLLAGGAVLLGGRRRRA